MNKYPCQLVGSNAELMVKAVNEGIDSRLRGVTNSWFEQRVHMANGEVHSLDFYRAALLRMPGDSGAVATKLHCLIDREDLLTIILRLLDLGETDDNAHDLANSIIYNLNDSIEDVWLSADDHISYSHYDDSYNWDELATIDEFWQLVWPSEEKSRE